MLTHFDPKRQLYVDFDASKAFGFGAVIYHTKDDNDGTLQRTGAVLSKNNGERRQGATVVGAGQLSPGNEDTKKDETTKSTATRKPAVTLPPKKTHIQPILFLSRLLADAETRYWPTELKMAGLAWVIKKARHMVEAAEQPTIIYTDHSALVSIVRQTSLSTASVEKLNLRLVRASEFL